MLWEYGTQVRYPMEALTRVREDGEVELVWLEGEYPGGWRPWGRPSWSNRPVSDEMAQSYYVETECRMNGYAYLKGVNHLVDVGVIPAPGSQPCADCGHDGNDRRHEYDHHRGYAPEHHEDVEVVCSSCHHLRERSRRG